MTTPNPERTAEKVEDDLKKVRESLAKLIEDINKQGYQEEGDKDKIEELEKEEEKLKKELEDLKNGVSPNASENGNDNAERGTMTKEEAMQYLQNLKGKSWSELTQDSRNWIMAVQIVLADKGYKVGKIDGLLGKRTKSGVKEFQKKAGFTGKDVDGLPGPKTINAILNGGTDVVKDGDGKDDTEKTVTDNEGNTFTGTLKDGKPWNGTYKMKDGDTYTVKDGKIE